VVEVLRHLARHWSAVPPVRKQERKQTFARIHVVHDFDDVVAIIAGESKTSTSSRISRAGRWRTKAKAAMGPSSRIRLPTGCRSAPCWGSSSPMANAWGVGIVRRLTNGANNHRYVGIQTLSKGGARVKVFPAELKAGAAEGADAVLLPSSAADSMGTGELNLLMRMGTFSPKQSLQMRAYERDYLLVPKQLLEVDRTSTWPSSGCCTARLDYCLNRRGAEAQRTQGGRAKNRRDEATRSGTTAEPRFTGQLAGPPSADAWLLRAPRRVQ